MLKFKKTLLCCNFEQVSLTGENIKCNKNSLMFPILGMSPKKIFFQKNFAFSEKRAFFTKRKFLEKSLFF